MSLPTGDSAALRKARGAFFTPLPIAEHLAAWAIRDNATATILDPTCGDGVFLLAAASRLTDLGQKPSATSQQLFGIDLHQESLLGAAEGLANSGHSARLLEADFFTVPTPDVLDAPIPLVDAVVGNPPFIRYQRHTGDSRRDSVEAARKQGVTLSGLASSWAASLAHASGFLKPHGRLALVLPAEMLTVGYAEPIRAWLRNRFERVNLVIFEKLQFKDAAADVVLLLAEGSGGCESFSLWHVENAEDLASIKPYEQVNVTPPAAGKWSDLLVPRPAQSLYRRVTQDGFVSLRDYGTSELGAVTGANNFFTLSESDRLAHGLGLDQVEPISPPGTRHITGASLSKGQWNSLKASGERVWLFRPRVDDNSTERIRYTDYGHAIGVDQAYKCKIRTPWWRPPEPQKPDLFFTYMSHNYPRLIANSAKVGLLNSMHAVNLHEGQTPLLYEALPYMCLNSVTMLGAEITGRSYGGGVLKMEPREAALLPLPSQLVIAKAWDVLKPQRKSLDGQLRRGHWTEVAKRVDAAVLGVGLGLETHDISLLLNAARKARERRVGRS